MNAIETLEQKLKKAKSYDRSGILQGVYKQLAVSHKGKQSNGEFRRAVEDGSAESMLFVNYVSDKLEGVGLTNHAARLRHQNYQGQMSNLQEHVGETVNLMSVRWGSEDFEQTKIQSVEPFTGVSFEGSWIPFMGYDCGIKAVFAEDGKPIFLNPKMGQGYDVRGKCAEENLYNAKREVFGNAMPKEFVPTPKEEPPKVTDAELSDYVSNGKLSPMQAEWIGKHDNSWMGRGYALNVAEAANELYSIVERIEDKSVLDGIAGEVIELSNHGVDRDPLSKPEDQFSPESKQIMAKLDEQDHSGNSYHWALRKFVEVVAEKKDVQYTPKPGLKNGAILHIEVKKPEAPAYSMN